MTSSSDAPTPPEGIPNHLVTELHELTPEELRNTIIHAQELLQFQEEKVLQLNQDRQKTSFG